MQECSEKAPTPLDPFQERARVLQQVKQKGKPLLPPNGFSVLKTAEVEKQRYLDASKLKKSYQNKNTLLKTII